MTKASDNDFPSLLLTEQGSAPTTPAASHQRLYIRTSDHTLVTVNSSGTVTAVSGGGGGGGTTSLLAVKSYAPGSDTTIGSSTSATLTDVDATNLSVVFTAPSSGNVLIRLTGLAGPSAGSPLMRWGVRESSSIVAGPVLVDPASVTAGRWFSASFYITGVSAGSHTYKWGLATSTGTCNIYGGPTYGAAVMEIYGAP